MESLDSHMTIFLGYGKSFRQFTESVRVADYDGENWHGSVRFQRTWPCRGRTVIESLTVWRVWQEILAMVPIQTVLLVECRLVTSSMPTYLHAAVGCIRYVNELGMLRGY